MARKVDNDKNIPVIEMSIEEAMNVNIGPICDNCNDPFMISGSNNIYYIPGLNMGFCENCYKEYINKPSTQYYKEDEHYIKVHYNYYAEKLNLETI